MHVLVTAASKHGATLEIAERIAEVLAVRGHRAEVVPCESAGDAGAYDAVVLGSAVYAGRWLGPARELAEEQAERLAARPLWLFSSGPLGAPDPRPEGDPADVPELAERLGARGHALFAGKLDRGRLGFAERAIVRALRAPEGDFRDWDAIESWAGQIAEELAAAA
jgi:menaquinone-dependent protoporphyrinogen oxidase